MLAVLGHCIPKRMSVCAVGAPPGTPGAMRAVSGPRVAFQSVYRCVLSAPPPPRRTLNQAFTTSLPRALIFSSRCTSLGCDMSTRCGYVCVYISYVCVYVCLCVHMTYVYIYIYQLEPWEFLLGCGHNKRFGHQHKPRGFTRISQWETQGAKLAESATWRMTTGLLVKVACSQTRCSAFHGALIRRMQHGVKRSCTGGCQR